MKLIRQLTPLVLRLPKIPLPWLGVGVLALAALILHRIPHRMEVTLHLLTERLSFIMAGTDKPVSLLRDSR